MNWLEVTFWVCALTVGYACVGYPLALAAAARLWPHPPQRRIGYRPSVSFVICAYNEAARIAERVREIARLIRAYSLEGEIMVVTDGCSDETAREVERCGAAEVRLVELPSRQGKASALSAGSARASGEILVLADVRQQWAAEALAMLLENFADPSVGAVSGDLMLEAAPGVLAGVGLYWRCEKWLRRREALVHSTVGVTGAICAVRRSLLPKIPQGTILDDVYWPLCVAMAGSRVIHEQRAMAFDRLPQRATDEFRRKVRTLAGNFQLVARLPQSLLPWKNPIWLQWLSHKLLRLVMPWSLLLMLVCSLLLEGPIYRVLLVCQAAFYGLALLGTVRCIGNQLRPAAAAASVMVLNAAAWLAFWVWVTGQASRSWHKARYLSEG